MAYSDTSLENNLHIQNTRKPLTKKEKEVINLVASQENACHYCLSAHTIIGKINGLTDEQILEIRSGSASFDRRLNALVHFTYEVTALKGNIAKEATDNFLAAGYTKNNIADVIITVADKIAMNYLHNLPQAPTDFSLVPNKLTTNTIDHS